MRDPVMQVQTPELIRHIRLRYHASHRQELPGLVALARRVEGAHAEDIHVPHGLTRLLEAMSAVLEQHMSRQEELVFPAIESGRADQVKEALAAQRGDHDEQLAALNRIAAITHGFRLPPDACAPWRRLYAGLGKLAEDLDEHRYLEGRVLFPRFRVAS